MNHAAPRQRRRRSLSLFWRTFLLLTGLLLGCVVAWLQTLRTLEFEPRALQDAQQLASLVNLSRAALMHADPIGRVSLVKTLKDEENLRIAMREPTDQFKLYNQDGLSRRVSQMLAQRLGPGTVVAREVNGFEGLWVGFRIEQENYWLITDPERIGHLDTSTVLVWLAIAMGLSLAGAALLARLLDRPLKRLSQAAGQVRLGNFNASRLDEHVATTEIREVNVGFNRMAERLQRADQDRALMLAGISHDLRTPLARLRLETEMSVADEEARQLMAADIEQANTIIDKFLDYARPQQVSLGKVHVNEVVESAVQSACARSSLQVDNRLPEGLLVRADDVELGRVFQNLLENALRYGKSEDGQTRVDLSARTDGAHVVVTVRDHGPGVPPDTLERLTEPFYRGNEARTAASGSGLGLAIVRRTVERMGGQLTLSNAEGGGLQARLQFQRG